MTCEIFFIPASIILLLFFKYSDSTSSVIYEYSNFQNSSELNYGLAGRVVGLIFLVFHIVLTLAYKGFGYEIRHTYADKTFTAKSTPDVDLKIVWINLFHCICFTSIQQSHYFYYAYANSLTYGYITWSFLYYLPIYSDFMNYYESLIYFDCFCISLFFVVAEQLKDAAVVTSLAIIFQPVIFILAKNLIELRKSKIKDSENYLVCDLKVFELSARNSLNSDENSCVILQQLNQNHSIHKNKLTFVYQANYCDEILKNSHLALVKASRTDYKGPAMFTNFQIYKCQKHLEKLNRKTSSGLRLFLYLRDLNYLLKEDKKFCSFFLKFIEEILSIQMTISNLFTDVKILANLIKKMKYSYENCLKKYPNSQIMNEMYGSFLSKVLFDQEKGERHLSFSLTCAKSQSFNKELNTYLKKNLYYMVISGDSSDVGKLLYASNNLIEKLGISFDKENVYYLSDFIPNPYSHGHDFYLTKFINDSLRTEIINNIPLFLRNSKGYLIECFIQTECVGFDSSVKFIVILEFSKNFTREAAIIDKNWEIFSHTERFPALLQVNTNKLEKKFLFDIFPISLLEDLREKKMMVYDFYSKTDGSKEKLGLIFVEKQIFTVKVTIFYVVDDKEIVSLIENFSSMTENKRKVKILKINKLINDQKIKNVSKKNAERFEKDDLNNAELLTNEQNQESSNSIVTKELKLVTLSKKSLSSIKLLLFFTVAFT